jgi:hypothetical protein
MCALLSVIARSPSTSSGLAMTALRIVCTFPSVKNCLIISPPLCTVRVVVNDQLEERERPGITK